MATGDEMTAVLRRQATARARALVPTEDAALRWEAAGAAAALAYGYLSGKTWPKVVGAALGAAAIVRVYRRHVPAGPLTIRTGSTSASSATSRPPIVVEPDEAIPN